MLTPAGGIEHIQQRASLHPKVRGNSERARRFQVHSDVSQPVPALDLRPAFRHQRRRRPDRARVDAPRDAPSLEDAVREMRRGLDLCPAGEVVLGGAFSAMRGRHRDEVAQL